MSRNSEDHVSQLFQFNCKHVAGSINIEDKEFYYIRTRAGGIPFGWNPIKNESNYFSIANKKLANVQPRKLFISISPCSIDIPFSLFLWNRRTRGYIIKSPFTVHWPPRNLPGQFSHSELAYVHSDNIWKWKWKGSEKNPTCKRHSNLNSIHSNWKMRRGDFQKVAPITNKSFN